MSTESTFFDGGCTCRFVRYRMTTRPLFVHCCHCRWCQRETGASFALNALIEADRVQLLQGEVEVINTPSNSGKARKSHAVRGAASRFGATTLEPATLSASFVSVRSMNPTVCRRTFTSTLLQSNPGSFFRPTCLPSLNTTEHPTDGPRKALNAEPSYWHDSSSSNSQRQRTWPFHRWLESSAVSFREIGFKGAIMIEPLLRRMHRWAPDAYESNTRYNDSLLG